MKAITICQPYAHLIAIGEKRVENRSWATRHRGPLAIHAGKSMAWIGVGNSTPDMAFGAIVALADLVDCVEVDCEADIYPPAYPWMGSHKHAIGPWCWVLENVRRLITPYRCKGAQGLWNAPDALLGVDTVKIDVQ